MGLAALAAELYELAIAQGLTLGLAESCTGGLVAATLTDVPGSSQYFLGGVVSYANEVKEKVLGVPAALLAEHGAVSAEVAQAMARGVRSLLGSDVGLSITGIAGPGGATPTKPVGLVFVAVAGPWGERWRSYRFAGERVANKRRFAAEALSLAISYVRAGGAGVSE